MIYKNYFSIYEFMVDPNMRNAESEIPAHVVDKIIQHHLPELNDMADKMNGDLFISQHSGYRSVEWELNYGRNGTSQHTFSGLGAVDISTEGHILDLVALAKKSSYKRVCFYPYKNFLHLDFKGDNRHYFEADKQGTWQYKGKR